MWRLVIQVFCAISVAVFMAREATGTPTAVQDGGADLQERVAALELLVSSQTQTQEILQQSLSQETDRRLAMETLLLRTLDEDRLKLQQLESSLKVDHDRMVALESTLQQEISLREDAEMSGEDILLDLSKKISVMEGDLSVVSLLDSRARSLEEQSHLQMEEISSLQQQHHHTRRGVEQLKRELRRQRTALADSQSDATHTSQALGAQLDHLTSWCLALNDSADEQGKLLLEAQKRAAVLNTSLGDARSLLNDLTGAVTSLQQAKEDNPLVLCPVPYRKVGKDCFYLLEARLSWEEAREECVGQGVALGGKGDLAEPSDISAFRHYVDNLQTDSKYLWVGGRRENDQGWWWVSGRSLEEVPVPWDLSEPDNAPDQHHLCVHSVASIKFHDCTRRALLSAICQVS